MFKKGVVLFLAIAMACTSFSQQTKEEIQRKQQQLQSELAELNSTLSDIKKNKKQSVSQLALVQRKIKAREELIGSINKELRKLDDEIYLNNLDIYRYKRELDTLKSNYAKSLVFAYKNRSNYDYLNFIFSATTFNDAVKRMSYLKSYRQFRETQVGNILKTQDLLQTKIDMLSHRKQEKGSTLQEQGKQLQQMEVDRREKDEVVRNLKGQEKELAGQIADREKARRKLQAQLQLIIRREIAAERLKEQQRQAQLAKQREEERKRRLAEQQAATQQNTQDQNNNTTPSAGNNTALTNPPPVARNTNRTYSPLESTPENMTASVNFENSRGRLPWPVSAGTVISSFGVSEISGTRLRESNDGIDIGVPVGTTVKAVADGEVSAVVDDPGGGQVVIVRHGKYFTTYSNLSSVSVTRKDKVQAGTILGKAGASDDGGGLLKFIVMNEQGNFLNPQGWLRSR